MNFQAHRGKGLHLGFRCDSFFLFVAIELSSNQVLWIQRRNAAEYFDLFIADGVAVEPGGHLHGQKSYDLKHVVFYHVADRTSLVVKLATTLNAKLFRHRDLDTLDVVAVPDRLQKTIGEAKNQQIEDRLFTKVVVDPKNSCFWKHRPKSSIQLLRGSKIVSEGFLHDDPRIFDTVRLGERLDDACKEIWRNRQIVRRATGRAKGAL